MRKGRKYDISDTNIGNLGTPLEKAIKEAAAGHESAWKKVHKTKPGLYVWRIEKFLVVAWPKKDYGKFFNGDSYICLNIHHDRGGKGKIIYDIHYWIGDESTQDEYGTAAYKTTELDDFLSGKANHHRETQGNETRAFRALFKKITIMEGGIESGFTHVEALNFRKRLLWIKGGMNTVVREVPLSWESLNSGDSFILDTGAQAQEGQPPKDKPGYTDGMLLLVFHGQTAAPMEKVKASGLAQSIDDQRGGKPERETFHDGQSAAELKMWWDHLGSRPPTGKSIKTAEEGGDDKEIKVDAKRLMKVSDASGKLSLTEVATGDQLSRNLLDSDDVFLLDDSYEVMVWIGLGASSGERKNAMSIAQKYLNDYNLPKDRGISKIMEGGENEQFEQAFEVGVMSTARPGDGVKFSGNIDKIRGLQKTKAAAGSVSATYKGSGGPGVMVDFDELYRQPSADPAEWRGRTKPESKFSQEMQDKQLGAYNTESGWVSSLTKEQRDGRQRKIQALEEKYVQMGKDAGAVHAGGSNVLTSLGAEGSIEKAHKFNAGDDAAELWAAMKGLGTRKGPIVRTLTGKTIGQRIAIRNAYESEIGRDLFKDIESEWQIGGNFERILKVLIRDPYERDANFLFKAMKHLRPDTTLVIQILATQEGEELQKVGQAYKLMFPGHDLAEDLAKEFTGDSGKLFTALVGGSRPPAGPIDQAKAKADAKRLYDAGESKFIGCDEAVFIDVFSTSSYGQIVATADAYPQHSKKKHDLRKAMKKKVSGSLKTALVSILDVARDPTAYWAERLHKALEGQMIGTHDTSLIHIIVGRSEFDLSTIEAIFASSHGKALQDVLMSDTSRSYMETLLKIVNGNKDDLHKHESSA
jgi:gelsolin